MTFTLPPAVRLAEGLARDIEQAAAKFPRRYRYTFGEKLRACMWTVLTTVNRAARDRARQAAWLDRLVWEVDELKLALQLGKQLRVFASFGQFEKLARDTAALGRQIGGWHKQHHPQGQSPRARAPGERAKTLSTRAASADEANG
ncbi:MAG TPA: four helix bundle protein [Frateuria sp.]|uniref:four helix bundle protein n=1 Tax=Frateuria sp. TaxID=2211372 RepID=UPI002D80A8CB|nr:four helix bundle protein [Frateuria sp.]HET6807231.1 four helix bundle protein [Frateuria sp.]